MNKLLHKRASALPTLMLLMLLALIPAKLSAQDFSYTYEGKTLNYTVIDEEAKTVQTKAGYYDFSIDDYTSSHNVYGNLVIPSEVEYGNDKYTVTDIGYASFYGNRRLTSVTIPNSVTSIGDHAFDTCSSLISVTIPNSVTSIPYCAFYGCSGLTSITIPNSVTTIGGIAFSGCSSLTSITIPNSVTSIGSSAFYGCSGLTSVIIPDSVTSIGSSAFYGCSGLTSVIIPDSVTSIENSTFSGCIGLTSITIPNAVTSIGSSAFYGCSGLTSITIPNSVTSIARFAFSGCNNLTNIKLEGHMPPEFADNSFTNYDAEVTVPEGTIPAYLATDWAKFSTIKDTAGLVSSIFTDDVLNYRLLSETEAMVVPGNYSSMTTVSIPERVVFEDRFVYVTAIGNAFTDCTNITSLVLPKRLTKILNNAFSGCTGLTAIDLPETLTTIGENAFSGCTSLTGLDIPKALTTIGNYAFYGCTQLGVFTVPYPSSLTYIGDYAFYGCTRLKGPDVELGTLPFYDKLEYVGDYAFNNCKSIKGVYFNSLEISIGNYAFSGCTALKTLSAAYLITMDNNRVAIGDYAFSGCTGLENISMDNRKNAITTIGKGAFENCNKLDEALLGNPVSVAEGAFAGCSSLGEVKVNWPEVEEETFAGCANLQNIVLNDNVTTIASNAFTGMTALSNLNVPSSVTSIGSNAFVFNTDTPVTVILEDGSAELSLGNSFVAPEINLYIGRNVEANGALCSTANEVTFGNGVTSISDNLFNGVSGLKTVNFGSSIETIGANAFNGCGLTELVLPPHVKTLGDNAFAGNNIKNIAIGSEITEIGEKAFDGANELAGVSITAITPPAANNNSFSYYDCPLYVTPGCVDTYYNFTRCWYRFSGHELIPIDKLTVEGNSTVNLKPGETYKLSVGITPANASLPYIFWRSTNPEFATVDSEGNVTRVDQGTESAQADGDVTNECKIIAETLYADVPVAEFTIQDSYAGIDEIVVESTAAPERPNDIYNMQGVCLKRNASQADIDALTTGLYIIGGKKVLVK